MIDKLKHALKKKNLLIVGKSLSERTLLIKELIDESNFDTYCFPKGIKTLNEYIHYVEKTKLYNAWYRRKGKFGVNQLLDFHWDWMNQNNSLVVLEEIQYMEESWKLELVRLYMNEIENHKKGEKFIHLIISQENEDNLIEKLAEKIDVTQNENRTKRQIIEGSLELIDISEN